MPAGGGVMSRAAKTRYHIRGSSLHVQGLSGRKLSNEMGAFMVVRAESHEAAAKLFEKHPHVTIFPGESVEIMPVLPIPGA